MSTLNKFTADIDLTGQAIVDPYIAAGDPFTCELVLSNGTADEWVVQVDLPLPPNVASVAFTATETGDATGATGFTASAAVPISEAVTFPAYTEVTYVVTFTTAAAGLGTATPVLSYQRDTAVFPSYACSETVAVGAVTDLHFVLEDRETFELTQSLHAFFDVGNNCATQRFIDRVESGFSIVQLLDAIEVAEAQGVINADFEARITTLEP